MTVRIMVVDDHPVVVDGLALLLRRHASLDIVGSAASVREATQVAQSLQPDIVLLDLHLPDALGTEAIGKLRDVVPGVKIIVFTAHAEHAGLHAAIEAGVEGCLLKDVGGTDLTRSILRVAGGERLFDDRISQSIPQLLERLSKLGITRREYEVLRLVAMGQTNPEIGAALGLSRLTVKTYLQTAMQKLGARNRMEAVARAHEASLL